MSTKESENLARLKSSAVLGNLGTLNVMDVMFFLFQATLVKPSATEGIIIIMPLGFIDWLSKTF